MESRIELFVPGAEDIAACAQAYGSAYSVPPWNEAYDPAQIEAYIASYLASDTLCCYALRAEAEIIGLALGMIVPGIDGPYLRVEDFCIAAKHQRRGYGGGMMRLLMEAVGQRGCDSVLLGTQKGFPSHRFYLKNGFVEIESALMYREIACAEGKEEK